MKVTIQQGNSLTAKVGIQGPPGPRGPAGPSGVTTITNASDVDVTNLDDGSLLIYNATSEKWVANKVLESQSIEGGHY